MKSMARPLDVTAGSFVFHAQNDSSPTGLPRKPFSCNTYGSPRKCCELSPYKKRGGGPVMVNQLFLRSNYRTLAIQSKERLVHQSQAYANPVGGALSGW